MAINEILTIEDVRDRLQGEITLPDCVGIDTSSIVVEKYPLEQQAPVMSITDFIPGVIGAGGHEVRPLRTSPPIGDAFDNLDRVRAEKDEEFRKRLNLALRAIGEAEAA